MKHNKQIRAAAFDIDGTLALMGKDNRTYAALPGAVEAVNQLRAQGMPVVAYTNGTFFSTGTLFLAIGSGGPSV